jgi:hypothetical protein
MVRPTGLMKRQPKCGDQGRSARTDNLGNVRAMWNWWRTSQGYCTLCAIAVIAAFLYAAFSIEPRLQPTPPSSKDQPVVTSDQSANQGNGRRDQQENFWQWTTKDAAGFYTFLLAAVTGGLVLVAAFQAGMFVWQLKLMREGINDAKTAADTATTAAAAATTQAQELRRSADATERVLTELERPWLFLEATQITWRDTPLPPGGTRGTGVFGTGVLNDWLITLKFRNIGRMPALIEACAFKIEDKASLPQVPDYSNSSFLATSRTVRSGDIIETQSVGPAPGRQNPLVFYGRVIYKELNGRTHHAGFALEMSWYVPACSPYNNDAYDYYD